MRQDAMFLITSRDIMSSGQITEIWIPWLYCVPQGMLNQYLISTLIALSFIQRLVTKAPLL
jgi:hypothetical protein